MIQAIAADGSSFDVQIEPGYPTNLDDPKFFSRQIIGHLFDRTTRWWKRNIYGAVYGTQTQRLGPNHYTGITIKPDCGRPARLPIRCSLERRWLAQRLLLARHTPGRIFAILPGREQA